MYVKIQNSETSVSDRGQLSSLFQKEEKWYKVSLCKDIRVSKS